MQDRPAASFALEPLRLGLVDLTGLERPSSVALRASFQPSSHVPLRWHAVDAVVER